MAESDKQPWDGVCQRCGLPTSTHIMSMFNTDLICMDCNDRELDHPKYREAYEAERLEILQGNYRYQGIGLPDDLKRKEVT